MKYKRIMTFFSVSAPLCVLIRTLQVLFTTDEKGFAAQDYRVLDLNMTILLFAAAFITGLLGALTHRCPSGPLRVSNVTGCVSAVYGLWLLFDTFFAELVATTPLWQAVLIKLFGAFSGLLMIAYGIRAFFNLQFPPMLFIAPVLFWVVKLICVFTTLNTLALTTGHILLLAAYCAVLYFMLEFAKLMNGLDKEYNFKKLLASGLCAVTLCATATVPHLIGAAFGASAAMDEGLSSMFLTLLTGVFILTFLLSHFSVRQQEDAAATAPQQQ